MGKFDLQIKNSQDLIEDIYRVCENYTPHERYVALLCCMGWTLLVAAIPRQFFEIQMEEIWETIGRNNDNPR